MAFGVPVQTVGTFTTGVAASSFDLVVTATTTTVGNTLLIHGVVANRRTIVSLRDSLGNTYAVDASRADSDTVFIARTTMTSAVRLGDRITLTISGGNVQAAFVAVEFEGELRTDQTASNTAASTTTANAGTTGTTTVADELVYAAFGLSNGAVLTADSPYTTLPTSTTTTFTREACGLRNVVNRTGTQNPTGRLDRTTTYSAVVVTYFAPTSNQTVALDVARETDSPRGLTVVPGGVTILLDVARESDSPQAVVVQARTSVGLDVARETDTAQGLTSIPGVVAVRLDVARETDTAQGLSTSANQVIPLEVARESDTALPITYPFAVVFVDSGGFPRAADGSVVMTSSTTAADQDETGFLRAPSGELVYTTSTVGARRGEGFLRSPSHALVIAVAASGVRETGFLRDSNWALCVTTTGPWTVQEGFMRDSSSRLAVTLV